ncbi:tachykinin-like peptides receptor 86C [Brachionichthys hirsutus]|uniref:tachykinin-like peptides receptor 86C n=1 Tax=Brachionichthys hirsutus TaxID=412623 RepID=UPI003604481A
MKFKQCCSDYNNRCDAEDAEELLESIIRGFMFLAGILGNNWLAIRSLPARKGGVHTSEVLFLNLAVSNLITNYLVDLPDTMADFAGRWFLGETYCGIFRFCADLSETSSIYTTLFISVFWHQKLVGSLKRGGASVRMDSLRLVGCLLAGSWTVAVVFSVPHFFFVTLETGNDSHEDCVDVFPDALAQQTYEAFYLTLANAVPLAGIVFASVQIVVSLLQNQRRIKSRNSEADEGKSNVAMKGAENGNGGESVRAAKSVVAVASVFLFCWLTHLFLRITNNIQSSSVVVEIASYLAASYTCIIPYIFLHGVQKLTCSCKR